MAEPTFVDVSSDRGRLVVNIQHLTHIVASDGVMYLYFVNGIQAVLHGEDAMRFEHALQRLAEQGVLAVYQA